MNKLPLAVLAICLGGVQSQAAPLRTMTTLHSPIVRLSDLFGGFSAAVIDEVPTGRLYLDGETLTPEGAGGLWERKKIAFNGYVGVSVAIGKGGVSDGPVIMARGFSEPDGRPADESLEPTGGVVLVADVD